MVLLLGARAGAAVGLSLTAGAAGARDGGVLNGSLLAGAVLSWLGSTGAGGFLSADTDRRVLLAADHCCLCLLFWFSKRQKELECFVNRSDLTSQRRETEPIFIHDKIRRCGSRHSQIPSTLIGRPTGPTVSNIIFILIGH